MINPILMIIPNGTKIVLVKYNALSTPKYFLHSHIFGLVSVCLLANVGLINANMQKIKPIIPAPTKSTE